MNDSHPSHEEADWQDVRALFEACLDLPEAERRARLEAASADLRAEVEALLREATADRRVFDPDIAHAAMMASAEEAVAIGGKIGGYEIAGVLGHGGMSTVYLARQEHPRRLVALKLLRATVANEDAARRFTNEAELLARLQHPGIAQIYRSGLHSAEIEGGLVSWPFLVMEYVAEARTLRAWVEERHRSDEELLDLFLDICDAVQHAHERGVVHRDLKPQNILVDPPGRPKLIDFGIARSIAESSDPLTLPGDVLGTLQYMSPEQATGSGIADTRTDVHALGILLFELLTGSMPFDYVDKSLPEIGRILAETPPRALSDLRPDLDRDLGMIVARALAKDPRRRYATAGTFADDIRRFRACEPIEARPPSLLYQVRMFARRRRGLVAAVLLLLLVTTTGGITSLVYAVRASEARALARREADTKDKALQRTLDLVLRTVLDLPQRLESIPRATSLRRTLLEEAANQLDFLEKNLPMNSDRMLALARAHAQLGIAQVADATGDPGAAADARFTRAEDYLERILAGDPHHRDALHLRAAIALRRGTLAFNSSRDLETAERQWNLVREAIERLEKIPLHDPKDRRRLLQTKASYEYSLGMLAMMDLDLSAEIEHLERSLDLILEASPGPTHDADTCLRLANTCLQLAMAHEREEGYEAAAEIYAAGLRHIADAPDDANDQRLEILRYRLECSYGHAMGVSGHAQVAIEMLENSYHGLMEMHRSDPDDYASSIAFGSVSTTLAEHLLDRGRAADGTEARRSLFERARSVARQGLEVAEQLAKRGPNTQIPFIRGICRHVIEACDAELE